MLHSKNKLQNKQTTTKYTDMRLLTHNSLKSPVKDVAKGYPMKLEIADMEVCVCVCV